MTMSQRIAHAHTDNRMTATQVSRTRFNRTALGRRGYDTAEVDAFIADVARELARRFEMETSLRAEADNFKRALRDWQSRASDQRQAETMRNIDSDAVNLLSQAQQQAEGYVTQAQDYCRQIIGQARGQAREVLQLAREQAEVEAERAVSGVGSATTATPNRRTRSGSWRAPVRFSTPSTRPKNSCASLDDNWTPTWNN